MYLTNDKTSKVKQPVASQFQKGKNQRYPYKDVSGRMGCVSTRDGDKTVSLFKTS